MKNLKSFEDHLNESESQSVTLTVPVSGRGNKLYAVVTVDEDDSEDSRVEFYRAKDEDDLFDIVKAEFLGKDMDSEEEDEDDEEWGDDGMGQMFDDDWGVKILHFEIGRI